MVEKTTFSAVLRSQLGKSVKQLRALRQIPANITTPNQSSVAISVNTSGFNKLYNQVGDTGLIYIKIEGETTERPVLVEDIQVHPLTGDVLHVVLKQVNLKEKITAEVPVELMGENTVVDCVVITVHDSIEVEALPADFPEKFVVDISKLTEPGQMITFADLEYDKSKVKLEISEEEMASPVVMLQEHKEEVAEETPVEAPAEGDVAQAPTDETPAEKAE